MAWPSDVRRSDLRIEYMRGSGPGGQNVNKVNSACRITHLPTGIQAESRTFRDQPQNRKAAFLRLAERLLPMMREAIAPQLPLEREWRQNVVRSYDVENHRTADRRVEGVWRTEDVLDGELGDIHVAILTRSDGPD